MAWSWQFLQFSLEPCCLLESLSVGVELSQFASYLLRRLIHEGFDLVVARSHELLVLIDSLGPEPFSCLVERSRWFLFHTGKKRITCSLLNLLSNVICNGIVLWIVSSNAGADLFSLLRFYCSLSLGNKIGSALLCGLNSLLI